MKLEQLRHFIKVVEYQSFNQAAKALYITQPALTASIQALENELQITLLRRTNKGTFPTEYGKEIYQDCKDILDALDAKILSWEKYHQKQQSISSVVQLATIPVACDNIMQDILIQLQQDYPQISVILHEISMDHFIQEMSRARYNIGLTAISAQHYDTFSQQCYIAKYHHKNLVTDEFRVFLSTQHPYAQKDYVTAKEFLSLNMVDMSYHMSSVFNKFKSKQNTQLLNSLGCVLQAAVDNRGATIFLYHMLKNNWYVKNGFICIKPVENALLSDSYQHVLVCAKENDLSEAEKIVIEYILRYYQRFFDTPLPY